MKNRVTVEEWVARFRAAGMDDLAMKRLHAEFELREPAAHHAFLLSLGISEKGAVQIRQWSADAAGLPAMDRPAGSCG
jgi:hypothetical protein